jgi:hypothetical protein
LSFFKRLAIFVLILAAMIISLGLLPGAAHSTEIQFFDDISRQSVIR